MEEAHRMGQITGRADILQAMADDMGYALVKIPEMDAEVDVSVSIRKNVAEFGRWMDVIDQSLDDTHITQTERKALEDSVLKVLARTQHLQSLLSSMANKPNKINSK